MVKNPEIGGQYWFVTDIWERFCPVPVTIVAVNEEYGALLIRWDIGEADFSAAGNMFLPSTHEIIAGAQPEEENTAARWWVKTPNPNYGKPQA